MSSNVNQNYYEILGISHSASDQEIRNAYKSKTLISHPDKASLNNLTFEKATEAFKLVNEAYEVLSDPQKRKQYDMKINGKIFFDKSTPSNSNFYEEAFNSFFSSGFYRSQPENDYESSFVPDRINQEISNIIEGDSTDGLDQFLKSNSFENSLLKTILYQACIRGKFNIVKYLIEVRKLSAHLKVFGGLTFTGPIFKAAAESGNLNLVKYLLEVHHVDIESQGLSDGTMDTALSRAAEKGHENVIEYLISKKANLNPKISNSNILNCAIKSKKLSIVMLLVEAGSVIDNFSLGTALKSGVLDIVKYLLQKRPGIKVHRYTSSPACLAISSGNIALVKYLEQNENLDIFEKFQSWDDSIHLLMSAAAASGSIEMMKFLLDEKGLNEKVFSNVNYIQSILSQAIYNTEYHFVRIKIQEKIKFVQFLMEERRFVLPKEELEKLILDCAQFSGMEINSYLQSYLFDSDQVKKDLLLTIAFQGLEVLSLAELLKLYNSKMIKKGKYDDFGFEVHCQIQERKLSVEQLRDLFLKDKQSMTEALFYYSSYYYESDLSPLKLLLELGVDLNAENSEGIAAIHIALQSGGYNKIVQFYVDNKADLSKKNKWGQTAAERIKVKL